MRMEPVGSAAKALLGKLKLLAVEMGDKFVKIHQKYLFVTPSLSQPVKFPGWKMHTYTPANSVIPL